MLKCNFAKVAAKVIINRTTKFVRLLNLERCKNLQIFWTSNFFLDDHFLFFFGDEYENMLFWLECNRHIHTGLIWICFLSFGKSKKAFGRSKNFFGLPKAFVDAQKLFWTPKTFLYWDLGPRSPSPYPRPRCLGRDLSSEWPRRSFRFLKEA